MLAIDIMRGCVFFLSLIVRCPCTCVPGFGSIEFRHSIWQLYDALAADGDISSTSGTGVFTFSVSTLKSTITSHFSLPGVSAQGEDVPLERFSMLYSYIHSFDSVTEMCWDYGY